MTFAKIMKLHHLIPLISLVSPIFGAEADAPNVEQKAKYDHLVLTDKNTINVVQAMRKVAITDLDIKQLTVRKSIEHLLSNRDKKKGDYMSPIFLGDLSPKKVSLNLASSNLADCINSVCKQTGLKWTIFFYSGELGYPMLVVGNEKVILSMKSAKNNVKSNSK